MAVAIELQRQERPVIRERREPHREHLDVMRQKAELLASASDEGDDWSTRKFAVTDDEVEVAFLRERQLRKAS